MRTKRFCRVIDALLPGTRQGILAATLLQPHRAWYAADLARHLGTSRSSLQRELVSLTQVGILKCRREGRMLYVQADPNCPVFTDLRGLLAKTVGLVDLLRNALEPFAKAIAFAFVYGSVARAEESSTSDVDLLVVGDVGLKDLASPLQEAQLQIGRELSPKVYGRDEFRAKLAAREHFLVNILSKPKLFVIGSQHDLDQIAQRESRHRRAVHKG